MSQSGQRRRADSDAGDSTMANSKSKQKRKRARRTMKHNARMKRRKAELKKKIGKSR